MVLLTVRKRWELSHLILINDDYGIAVRGGYHCAGLAHKAIGTWDCGAVRMSMGIYNNGKEMKAAADAVYAISKG